MQMAQIFGLIGLMVLACSFWRIYENGEKGPIRAICLGIYEGVTLAIGGCVFGIVIFLAGAVLKVALQH
jgi:thiol:disulfide interchange protein